MPNWAKLLLGLTAAYVVYVVVAWLAWTESGRCFSPGPAVVSPTHLYDVELHVCGRSPKALEVTVWTGAIGDGGNVSPRSKAFSAKTPTDQATFAQLPGGNHSRVPGDIQVTWLDGSHLEVSFPAGTRWARGDDSADGVSVSYRERVSAAP